MVFDIDIIMLVSNIIKPTLSLKIKYSTMQSTEMMYFVSIPIRSVKKLISALHMHYIVKIQHTKCFNLIFRIVKLVTSLTFDLYTIINSFIQTLSLQML